MRILITGVAGFIGFHLAKKLKNTDISVFGIDNLNDYYDVNLKLDRLNELGIKTSVNDDNDKQYVSQNFTFQKMSISDKESLNSLFERNSFDIVCNLAAQAGVRYSITNPHTYVDSNILGFLNILEACKTFKIKHLVFSSSSSVYGLNSKTPFSVNDPVDHPISFYAVTKRTNELMAHTYSYLHSLPCTGLRFFTVYGPWGRPDMAPFIFVKSILNNEKIKIFNHGKMMRDFTYVDDVIEGIIKVLNIIPVNVRDKKENLNFPSLSISPFRIFNLGNSKTIELMQFLRTIELNLKINANYEFLDLEPGDVINTFSDMTDFEMVFGKIPKTSIEEGVNKFIDWYKKYYNI